LWEFPSWRRRGQPTLYDQAEGETVALR
jgi:hypothetical protein